MRRCNRNRSPSAWSAERRARSASESLFFTRLMISERVKGFRPFLFVFLLSAAFLFNLVTCFASLSSAASLSSRVPRLHCLLVDVPNDALRDGSSQIDGHGVSYQTANELEMNLFARRDELVAFRKTLEDGGFA